jgi:hypothetical protein
MIRFLRVLTLVAGLLCVLGAVAPARAIPAIPLHIPADVSDRHQILSPLHHGQRTPEQLAASRARYEAGLLACKATNHPQLNIQWSLNARVAMWIENVKTTPPAFLVSEALFATALFLSMFLLGQMVKSHGWNANYTRKALGLVLLAVPVFLGSLMPYGSNPILTILSFLMFVGYLALFSEPLRRRSQFLQTALLQLTGRKTGPLLLRGSSPVTWSARSCF